MWCLFVVGHDCGHNTFSNYTWFNDLIGNVAHGFILVPYWPWRLSHRRHHMYHNHIEKDYSHPWWTDETAAADPEGHAIILMQEKYPQVKYLFPIIGWPLYLFGLPDGNHWIPTKKGRLWVDTAASETIKAIVSTSCVLGWAYGLYAAFGYSVANFIYFHLMPVLIFGWWLVCTTYLQHHSEETVVYGAETWKFDLAAFQTVDREYGWGVDQLTHHITDGHVAHHLFFTKIPHYNLPMATKAIRMKLEELGLKDLYRKEITHNFPAVLYDSLVRFGFKTTEIKSGEPLHPRFSEKEAVEVH